MMMIIVTDMLPPDLMVIFAVLAIALLALIAFLFAGTRKWIRITGIVLSLLFALVISTVTSYMATTYNTLNEISVSDITSAEAMPIEVDVTEEPFNVYITGIDQWASEKGLDLERSDVNMILTVNPSTKKILMTSIPRDTYVRLHTAQQMDKLTHTGVSGVDETLNTVEDWLGIDLNYYVKLNFTGATKVINAMGGIKVYSPVAFESSIKGYKYKKGWNKLSGKQALYFARERKVFEGQDAVRVENQQRVMKAIIKRMTSKKTLLTKYGAIMEAAGDNISTNMSTEDMTDLVKMQISDLSEWDIQSQKIEGDYDMDYVASLTQSQKFSVYKASSSSVSKCKDEIQNILNPKTSELAVAGRERSKSFIVNMINHMTERVKNDEE